VKPAPVAKIEKPVRPTPVAKLEKPAKPEAATPVAQPVKTAKQDKPAKPEAAAKPERVAKLEKPSAPPAVDRNPTNTVPAEQAAVPTTAPGADADKPEFRWPARGRVIQGFKPGGNDGINIALPEGTQIKAAEGGVVAYAGNELKGYGNLVLIRHPTGFVSAYANNGDIQVKRGDSVKRGQTIASSGQSGNVSSPQLHFELRKGSTPVDPTNYLAGL
jgi:murein DD-endopeptidase MepM/ murein hydrolase activator NlpD